MVTAQVSLTDEQGEALRSLAERTGKTEAELLREAVEVLLARDDRESWLAVLRRARGMWKDRDDLPDFRATRESMDRSFD